MMMNYLIIFFLLIRDANCMDGGPRAKVGQFKYVVSLRYNFQHICTGAIIHKNYVITAQHCLFIPPIQDVYIFAGLIDIEDPNLKVLNIDRVYTYPAKEAMTQERRQSVAYHPHDIALLKLKQELVWTDTLGPVPLIKKRHVWSTCDICVVPGWDAQEDCNLFLLYFDAFVLETEDCVARVGTIYSNHRCVVDDIGDGITYPGDSGTPYVCSNELVGIIIRGYRERDLPSIVLDLSEYLPFISEITNDGKNSVEPGDYPYIVSIWHKDDYICGGTVIDYWRIVTAGDCVVGIPRKNLKIAAGRTQISPRDPTVNWFYAESIDVRRLNSMAVIRLTKTLQSEPNIGKIQLPESAGRSVPIGEHCHVFRWIPEFTEGAGIWRKLVWFSGIIVPWEQCSRLDRSRGMNHFCSTSPYGFPLTDDKDSGTPFLCDDIMYGMLLAVPSASQTPSVETVFLKIPSPLD